MERTFWPINITQPCILALERLGIHSINLRRNLAVTVPIGICDILLKLSAIKIVVAVIPSALSNRWAWGWSRVRLFSRIRSIFKSNPSGRWLRSSWGRHISGLPRICINCNQAWLVQLVGKKIPRHQENILSPTGRTQ